MTEETINELHNADDALELERGFVPSSGELDVDPDAEGTVVSAPEKSDTYYENLIEAELEQAELAAEAELQWLEKRDKNRKNARQQQMLADKRAREQYARELLDENERAMRAAAELSSQGYGSPVYGQGAPASAGEQAKQSFTMLTGDQSGVLQKIDASDGVVEMHNGYSPTVSNLADPMDVPGGQWAPGNEPKLGEVDPFPFGASSYENGGYPNGFSEAERLRKETVERDLAEQELRRRSENEALIEKLNAEGAERQKLSENYKSFGNQGIDYSGKELHSAYIQEAVATSGTAVIDAGAYSALRESYENSKILFRSYEGQVPEAVVTQYQENADRFFVVQRQIEQGSLKIVEAPVVVVQQPEGAGANGDNVRSLQEQTTQNLAIEQGQPGVNSRSFAFGVPLYKAAAPELGADYGVVVEQSGLLTEPSGSAREGVSGEQWAPGSDPKQNEGHPPSWGASGSGPEFQRRDSFDGAAPSGWVDASAPIYSISQERYDALTRKRAEALAEVASYGNGKIPEDVRAKFDKVSNLHENIQQKIDNGGLVIVSGTAGSRTADSLSAAGSPSIPGGQFVGSNGHVSQGSATGSSPDRYISQERLAALAKKHADVQKQVASYGDKEVPEALRVKAEKVGRVFDGLQKKIDSGAIIVVSQTTVGLTGAAGVVKLPDAGQNRARSSGGSGNSAIAQGTQAFFDINRDNFAPGAKRTGDRHIKPPKTPFQGSPINKYDKLKIYHSHNYSTPFEVATRRSLRALSDTVVYSAAQNEQTGAANTALVTAQRMQDVKNAAKVLVDTPRQIALAGRAVSDAGRSVQNMGRFFQGKDPLPVKDREPLTVRQLDKQYKGFFTADERAQLKQRFGDDIHLSAGQVRRKIIAQDEKIRVLDKEINAVRNQVVPMTAGERERWSNLKKLKTAEDAKLSKLYGEKNAQIAKNRDLKKEIKALQEKGSALTSDERKKLSSLMKQKAEADKPLRKFSGKVEAQKLKTKALKNEMRAVERKVGTVSSEVRKGTKGLTREKAAVSENMRRLQGIKSAQRDAALRNKRADWVNEKSGKKTIRKTEKEKLKLNRKDEAVLGRLKDRQGYSDKRRKLQGIKGARKQLLMSLGNILGRAARESEDSSIRTLMTADRMMQNRYLRTVLKYSAKTAMMPAVMAKKAAVGSYRVGRSLDAKFNDGKIGEKIDRSTTAVKQTVRKVEEVATRTVTNSRLYKELHGGLYNRAKEKISSKIPDRIKTRARKVSDRFSKFNQKRKDVLKKFNNLKKKIQDSKVGRFVSALGKGAKGLGQAFSLAKKALLKVGLVAGGGLIVICLIGAFLTAAGGAAGTLVFGESSSDGRISLDAYVNILNDEQKKINSSVANYQNNTEANGGDYKRVYVDYVGGSGSNNYKEIFSMAAVYFDQDLTNAQAVNDYMRQLFQASNYVTTSESEMYYCSGCEERDYYCFNAPDEYATQARKTLYAASDHSDYNLVGDRYGCKYTSYSCMDWGHGTYNRHGCWQHNDGDAMEDYGDCDNYTLIRKVDISPGGHVLKTYYYCQGHCSGNHRDYYCPGHTEKVCYGHVDLYVNVVCLGFDQIFAVDPGVTVGGDLGEYAQGDLLGTFNITYYCAEKYPHICNAGPPYKTASGTVVTAGRTIAVDPSVIPLGTPVVINGRVYVAEDTGGAIKGNRIDIAVESHQEALNLGRDVFKVYRAAEATGEPETKVQRKVTPYISLIDDSVNPGLTQQFALQVFGAAKEPVVTWKMDTAAREFDTAQSYQKKLQDYDSNHLNDPYTNAELNAFVYIKMDTDSLKKLCAERGLTVSGKASAYTMICEYLIPYDKRNPDCYVNPADDPSSGSEGTGYYFDGWNSENKDWVKEIYANMNSENYSGLDQILGNNSTGAGSDDVSFEGLVIQGSKIAVTYYSQHDSRWATRPIRSDSPANTISKAGCGFSSMAIVVSSMTSNKIDPPGMCDKYGKTHYAIGQGAYHSLIPDVSSDYGLSCTELRNSNVQGVIDALKQGKLVVALVGRGGYGWTGSGYYTGHGHFLVICGVTDDGAFLLADPNRADVSSSGEGVTIDYFVDSGIKKFWVIGK